MLVNTTSNFSAVPAKRIPANLSNLFLTESQFNVFYGVNLFCCITACSLYILLVAVLIRQSGHFTGSRLLILHQLIIEILMVAIHWPIWIATVAEGQQQRGVVRSLSFCQHYFFFYIINLTAVHYGLLGMALNRFVAIVFPHHYRTLSSKHMVLILIVFSWAMGFFCDFYVYLGAEGGFFPHPPYGVCNFNHPGGMYALVTVFRTYLPLSLTGLLYLTLFTKITVVWYRQKKVIAERNQADDPKMRAFKRRALLARVLFVMTVIHCVSFNAVPFVMTVMPWLFASQLSRQWVRFIFFSGFLSPPLVFFAMNQDCRRGVRKLLRIGNSRVGKEAFSSGNGKSGKTDLTNASIKPTINDTRV
ncbi:uncharacterized protein LOC129595124 [Paramacrobiotus metropolitanus]|uniref:uncharacterized protein LOC129595124 n=1 Tax=Paramacrobiotus metropolitanus TaxID=2943436 RepID=UPI0024457D3D|nr:uncharacterized protein LOC129595124 [Paramacrobiotus metropolitanus]